MRTSLEVTLDALAASDGELIGNLMQLYIHDLSAIFPHVALDADGRFDYPALPSYLAGSPSKHAFLLRAAGRIAGFALARRGSPASNDPEVQDVAEFFVLRQLRAQGVGRIAAALLWDRLPGKWTVRAAVKNADAVAFWRRVVAEYTHGVAEESEYSDAGMPWNVFSFVSPPR